MRIISWNINGIRRIYREYQRRGLNTFAELLEHLQGDIICLQELKAEKATIDPSYVNVPGWRSYFTFPVDKKAYSGVAIYVREQFKPVKAETAVCAPDYASNSPTFVLNDGMIGGYPDTSIVEGRLIDREGRVVILDFESFVVIGTYCPAGAETEDRVIYRRLWWRALSQRCSNLVQAGREIIMLGDLNVNCHPIDCIEADEDEYKFDQLGPVGATFYKMLHGTPLGSANDLIHPPGQIEDYFVDLGRRFNPDREKMYSCWSVKLSARAGNYGSRIDYVLATRNIAKHAIASDVQPDVHGSDHCPVYADFKGLDLSRAATGDTEMSNFVPSQATISSMFKKSSSQTEVKPSSPIKRPISEPESAQKKQKTIGSFFGTTTTPKTGKSTSIETSEVKTVPAGPERSQSFEQRVKVSDAFSSLFTKPVVPVCDVHKLPAKLYKTKKKGPNLGREFWMCSVNLGEGQCKFWKWRK